MDKSKEIKAQLEHDGVSGVDETQKYQQVFDLLETSPQFELGNNFADKVLVRLKKMDRKRRIWFLVLSSVGVLFLVLTTLVTFAAYYGIDGIRQFKDITGWAVFGGVMIVMIQYLDAKLVRKDDIATI